MAGTQMVRNQGRMATESRLKSLVRTGLRTVGLEVRRLYGGELIPALPLNVSTLTQFHYFWQMAERIHKIPGDFVECGVSQGRSLFLLAHLLRSDVQFKRHLWGCDSFQGFPEPSSEDISPRNPKKGEYKDTSPAFVRAFLEARGLDKPFLDERVHLVEGFFDQSLKCWHDTKRQIALLHIDGDLYQSYRAVLTNLFPYVAEGGVVLFDEYHYADFPGATQAVDEYFKDSPYHIQQDARCAKYYLFKTPDGKRELNDRGRSVPPDGSGGVGIRPTVVHAV